MSPGISTRSLIVAFAIVLGLYLAAFYGLEYRRHRKGPWEVIFSITNGAPLVEVRQPRLGIERVRLSFGDERATNTTPAAQMVRFDAPRRPVPFGRVIYEDLTFLPGVVTFDLFGHEIELLPRALVVNRRRRPWRSGETILLRASEKPAEPPHPPAGREDRAPRRPG